MSVVDVKNRYERQLLSMGAAGVFADIQRNRIIILVETPQQCHKFPHMIEGYAVECRVTGRVRAL